MPLLFVKPEKCGSRKMDVGGSQQCVIEHEAFHLDVFMGLYLPNKYNNEGTAAEKGRPGLRRKKNGNLSSGKGARWSRQNFNLGWFVCLLKNSC